MAVPFYSGTRRHNMLLGFAFIGREARTLGGHDVSGCLLGGGCVWLGFESELDGAGAWWRMRGRKLKSLCRSGYVV
jgi:hypothetical protein